MADRNAASKKLKTTHTHSGGNGGSGPSKLASSVAGMKEILESVKNKQQPTLLGFVIPPNVDKVLNECSRLFGTLSNEHVCAVKRLFKNAADLLPAAEKKILLSTISTVEGCAGPMAAATSKEPVNHDKLIQELDQALIALLINASVNMDADDVRRFIFSLDSCSIDIGRFMYHTLNKDVTCQIAVNVYAKNRIFGGADQIYLNLLVKKVVHNLFSLNHRFPWGDIMTSATHMLCFFNPDVIKSFPFAALTVPVLKHVAGLMNSCFLYVVLSLF